MMELYNIRISLVVRLASVIALVSTLPPPDRPYNVLMLLPVSSKSHRNVFMPLATELTRRGHKITMLSNHPPADDNKNITYINHELPYFREENKNMFEIRDVPSKTFDFFSVVLPKIAKEVYYLPDVQKLYQKRKDFDLVIIDSFFNELAFPFVHEQSFITISTGGLEGIQSAVLGNVQNPAYVPTLIKDFPHPFSFLDRVQNLFLNIVFPLQWRHNLVVPGVQKEIDRIFPDLPPLLEIERNQSLVLLNSHFSLSTPARLVPAQIEVGCMHCGPGKPLPKDIATFLSGSVPVVYFSLGSVARGTTMPQRYQKMLLAVFAKLPYKFIWKFEDGINDLPEDVLIRKWMPQQDILAHPNVKLFISHCGLLSSQEAMYHGKPVLGLPIFADQPKNAKRFEDRGMGKMLVWEEMTEDSIHEAIIELVSNPSYHSKISAVSTIFKDQLETPVDRAVFWTEYVIRHSGAVHLRSPERDLSWREFLNLDIIVLAHLFVFLVVKILKSTFGFCSGSKGKNTKKNKRD